MTQVLAALEQWAEAHLALARAAEGAWPRDPDALDQRGVWAFQRATAAAELDVLTEGWFSEHQAKHSAVAPGSGRR